MLLSSLINVYNLHFNGLIETISSIVSIIVLVVLPCGLVAAYKTVKKYSGLEKLHDKDFQEKYSELMSSDHKANLIGTYWKVIVSFRWTLTLLILVFAREHFALQILSLLSLSILNQSLLLGSKPLIEPRDQTMSVFNEIANSVYLYMLILLTDFMGDTGIRE